MVEEAEIIKSSRHQKIIGDFGENLICNWMSRSGFEVTIVDHTGIDIIAYNPSTDQRLGITVKSRTRTKGREHSKVNLFSEMDRETIKDACRSFSCEPWIGIYVECSDSADLYLTSLENYDRKYRKNRVTDVWKMAEKQQRIYSDDPDVKHIRIEFNISMWF